MPEFIPYTPADEQQQQDAAPEFVPYHPTDDVKKAVIGPSMRDQVSRQLGLFGRRTINTMTGAGQALADFGYGAASLATEGATGKSLQARGYPRPSEALQNTLSRLGLPQPETPMEKGVDFASGVLGGALDPASTAITGAIGKVVSPPAGFRNEAETARDLALSLRRQGVKIAPSQAGDSAPYRMAEGLGGRTQIGDELKFKNQSTFQGLARKDLGLPPDAPLTRDVLKAQASQIVDEGYKPIEKLPHIPVGDVMRGELADIRAQYGSNNSFPKAARNDVVNEVDKYLRGNQGFPIYHMTGSDAVREIKTLRQEARDILNSDAADKSLGIAKEKIAKAIENQIESSLEQAGSSGQRGPGGAYQGVPINGIDIPNGTELLANFRNARTMLAKNYAVQRMLADPDSGVLNASKAASAYQSGTKMTGGLKTIAQAGSPVFAKSTGMPRGDVPPMSAWEDIMLGGGAGAGLFGAPAGGAIAAVPLSRLAARKMVESNLGQSMMSRAGGSLFSPQQAARMQMEAARQAAEYGYLFDPYRGTPAP